MATGAIKLLKKYKNGYEFHSLLLKLSTHNTLFGYGRLHSTKSSGRSKRSIFSYLFVNISTSIYLLNIYYKCIFLPGGCLND